MKTKTPTRLWMRTTACSFQQQCAIARDLLLKNLTLVHDTVEWKESIKDRTAALGFQTPLSEQVYRAMSAVEYSERKRLAKLLSVTGSLKLQIPKDWHRRPERLIPRAADLTGAGFESMTTIVQRWTSAPSSRTLKPRSTFPLCPCDEGLDDDPPSRIQESRALGPVAPDGADVDR